MSNDKTKLLLILSVILVSLLSNILSNPFIELENKTSINHDTTLAYALPDPSRNNTDIQSTTYPIYKTNNSSSNVLALVHMGSTLSNQGNYTGAMPYSDKVLEIDPNNKDALNGKGDALIILGNYTQALDYLNKALAIDPNDKYILNEKGNALSFQGNDTQALQYYDKAISIDPGYKEALFDKADSLNRLGNYTQAIKYYDKALAIDPEYEDALNGMGDAHRGQGNHTQAVQHYDKALALYPYDTTAVNGKVNALDGKGDALHYQGNYTQAIQYYDKALAIDANDTYALDGIGKVFSDQANYTQAIQYYDKALAVNSTDTGALFDKQNAISKIVESGNTSEYDRGCIDAQISNPSERYINQFNNGPGFNNDAFIQVYNEGFDACSNNLPQQGETLKMFNIIVLKGNVTDETANTRICTTVSEGGPQTICQNLDNLKPENNSNSIESHIFTFENVSVNASFHSCIQRLIYPNVTLCDNYGSKNYQGPTVEQKILPFFGVDPTSAEDDEGYGICPTYLTEAQCYGRIVKTPDDGYDVNDTSIDQVSKQITLTEQQQMPAGSLTVNQLQVSNKPIVTNQTVILKQGLNVTLHGIDPNNKSLNFSIYTEPAKGTITFTKINSTSVNSTYFPLEDGILTDSFSYKASNGVLDSNVGKVTLTFFPPQNSNNGNMSSDSQSQSPVNQSSPEKQSPSSTEPNQTYSLTEPSAVYYEGLDWWGICNNSLVRSYISQPCETLISPYTYIQPCENLVTPDHRALTSQGKIVLEGILCPKGQSILSTIELFYGISRRLEISTLYSI